MQAFVDSSSSQEVLNGAILIKGNELIHNRVIDINNPFLSPDTDLAIRNHINTSRVIATDEAKTFVAASSLLHSLDGWGYLAHSVESLLKGDKGIAVHLAYYSELRATMSFLACEGIAALNTLHFCINSTGNISTFPTTGKRGTHVFVWEALDKYLSSSVKPKTDILKVFTYNGKNFSEWLNAIPNSSSIIADQVIKNWITDWSFDINLFSTDRKLRNEVSYKPKRLKDNSTINLTDSINKLTSFWNLLEPKGFDRFALLDQYLLKKFFKQIHLYITSIGITLSFDDMVESAFKGVRLPLSSAQKSFFSSINNHQLFVSANDLSSDPIFGILPISIIARATLMLRLTIGYTSNIFKNAGITKTEIAFFLDNIGIDNGFWEQTKMPNDFIKLWDDVGQSISSIETWLLGRTYPAFLSEINNELANELIHYKQINRAGFWGMVL